MRFPHLGIAAAAGPAGQQLDSRFLATLLGWPPPLTKEAQQRGSPSLLFERSPPPTAKAWRRDALSPSCGGRRRWPCRHSSAAHASPSRRGRRRQPPTSRGTTRSPNSGSPPSNSAARAASSRRGRRRHREGPNFDARFSPSGRPPPLAVWVQQRDMFSPDSKRSPLPNARSRSATRASPPPGGRRRWSCGSSSAKYSPPTRRGRRRQSEGPAVRRALLPLREAAAADRVGLADSTRSPPPP